MQAYRDFHKFMAFHANDVNDAFKARYIALTALTSKKGQTAGKQEPLRELAKLWGLSQKASGGVLAKVFQSGFMNRTAWTQNEQIISEKVIPFN